MRKMKIDELLKKLLFYFLDIITCDDSFMSTISREQVAVTVLFTYRFSRLVVENIGITGRGTKHEQKKQQRSITFMYVA